MAFKNWQVNFNGGTRLTTAGITDRAVFQSHLHAVGSRAGSYNYGSSTIGVNGTTRPDDRIHEHFFQVVLSAAALTTATLTTIRFCFFRDFTTSFDFAIRLRHIAYTGIPTNYSTIYTGTVPAGSNVVTPSVPLTQALDFTKNVEISVLVWGAPSANSVVGIISGTYIAGTYDDSQLSNQYPLATSQFRDVANRPGIVYDPSKTTSIFAEDQLARSAAIVGAQQALGVSPSGINSTVAADSNTHGLSYYPDWVIGFSVNNGDTDRHIHPDMYLSPTYYLLIGMFDIIVSSGTPSLFCFDDWLDDLIDLDVFIKMIDKTTGSDVNASLLADVVNRQITIETDPIPAGHEIIAKVNLIMPRQVELWNMPSRQIL